MKAHITVALIAMAALVSFGVCAGCLTELEAQLPDNDVAADDDRPRVQPRADEPPADGPGTPPPDGAPPPSDNPPPPSGTGTRLRVVAGNLTTGNGQSWDLGHGQRILQGLQPDVALLQELNVGDDSDAALRDFVDETFGSGFSVYREPRNGIPNGIVSRYPIKESGTWDDDEVNNRGFAWARIDVPGDKDLWAVSVHLLTASASVRNREAQQLRGLLEQHVPAGDLLVLGGDFNTSSPGESALQTFDALFSLSRVAADQQGDRDTNAARKKPYDWLLPDDDLDALQVPVAIGSRTYANGLVVDTRVYEPIGDLAPALAGDSGGPQMQHMAVVRDFALPAP